jgi:hypothetical protein
MNRGASASPWPVRRSRRPQTRLETSCTRTGRPRRHLTPVRQQVGERRLRPHGSHARHRGVTLRHSTDESFEQRRQARRRRVRREGCGSRRTLVHLTRTRLRAGLRVSHGWASVRPTDMAGRYSSEIRTGCANQRPSGSVRGAASDGCPYRDHQPSAACQSPGCTNLPSRSRRSALQR